MKIKHIWNHHLASIVHQAITSLQVTLLPEAWCVSAAIPEELCARNWVSLETRRVNVSHKCTVSFDQIRSFYVVLLCFACSITLILHPFHSFPICMPYVCVCVWYVSYVCIHAFLARVNCQTTKCIQMHVQITSHIMISAKIVAATQLVQYESIEFSSPNFGRSTSYTLIASTYSSWGTSWRTQNYLKCIFSFFTILFTTFHDSFPEILEQKSPGPRRHLQTPSSTTRPQEVIVLDPNFLPWRRGCHSCQPNWHAWHQLLGSRTTTPGTGFPRSENWLSIHWKWYVYRHLASKSTQM